MLGFRRVQPYFARARRYASQIGSVALRIRPWEHVAQNIRKMWRSPRTKQSREAFVYMFQLIGVSRATLCIAGRGLLSAEAAPSFVSATFAAGPEGFSFAQN